MAKGLRSSSKLAARNRKRYTDSSDYAVTAAARLNQVSSRLQQRVRAPKEDHDDEDDDETADDAAATPAPEANMEEDGEQGEPKKISTSGPRGSRNELWRKKHNKKGTKNGGRAKRRK